jgi:hypothetical protein
VRPGWPEAIAVLVIGVSLALKLAALNVTVDEDQRIALADLNASLAAQGYVVSVPRADLPIVRASHAGCSLTARILDPHGVYQDTELLKLPTGWSVAYGWRGEWQASLPRFWPLTEYYLARQAARLGASAGHSPVIMVSNQPGCALPNAAAADIRVRLFRSESR